MVPLVQVINPKKTTLSSTSSAQITSTGLYQKALKVSNKKTFVCTTSSSNPTSSAQTNPKPNLQKTSIILTNFVTGTNS